MKTRREATDRTPGLNHKLRAPFKTLASSLLAFPCRMEGELMAKPLVSDDLWAAIAPLLPSESPKPQGGRPRIPDRAALTGILFVLKSGIPWELLPQELGCGSGVTCWRRLRDWMAAGVWHRLHRVLLNRLGGADRIDWSRASADSASVPAKGGAPRPARTRRIAANRARSAMCWSTGRGSPWPLA
jgi:transposase